MIWRHIMLATSSVDSIPTTVLDRVGRIARGLQAEIELFHCVYEPDAVQPRLHGQPVEAVIAREVEERHRRLERFGDELRGQSLKVRSSVRWDFPMHEGVIRQALRHKTDLLILPAVRTAGLPRRTLTYREMSLIEACPCPLLLLKSSEVYSRGAVVAAVDPGHAHGKPEDLDEEILGAANTISRAMGDERVHAYHAVGLPDRAAERVAAMSAIEADVREMAARHDIPAVRVELGAVERSLPVFAREIRADVLVMGAVSRTFPERALFGHTAEKILDEVDCDVLVVKPRGFRSPIGPEPSPAVPRPV
jgi:universal stress protein E